ncbi:MAG TPA: ABC transporter ATP-binding protein [Gemmataceae bacterium]|jgi:lipoprotein-releasing system ATP-binding protein|nr:ABC transporter ATP-binding protein [Gemmataceae bacterium]
MLVADGLVKSYKRKAEVVRVLQGVDLEVHEGEFLSIVGASGSGKSTLLHVLGTLDRPDAGTVTLDGKRIDTLGRRDRDRLRNSTFGFIFQFYHLLPELTTLQNVLMPALVGNSVWNWWGRRKDAEKRATEMLERVGLGKRLKHKSSELSGGEMQRTAIARALVAKPKVLFADEPTGNLDEATGESIVQLLRSVNQDEKVTILMVTHNLDLVRHTDRMARMAAGKLSDQPAAVGEEFADCAV